MKKILTVLGFAASFAAYAQGGPLIINNYSAYDFVGEVVAHNVLAPCYPRVGPNTPIKVPADSHMGNGLQLEYANYKDQFGSSLYPMTNWSVYTSPNGFNVRPWDHASVQPGGAISNNTRWGMVKFGMVHPGTNTGVTGFSAGMAFAGNTCYSYPDSFTSTVGPYSADFFTITSGTTTTTYIQLY